MRPRGRACGDMQVVARSEAFSALGCCVRLELIRLLGRYKALRVCEVQRQLKISQPTVSHHLKILRKAGVVDVRRRGTSAYYSLHQGALKALLGELLEII